MWKATRSLRSLALAAIIAVGLTAVWCAMILWIIGIIESSRYRHQAYEQLYAGIDGEVYILRYAKGVYSSQQEVLNISREPVQTKMRSLLHPTHVARRPASGAMSPYRFAAVNDGDVPATLWYLVHDGRPAGRAYGVGYHATTRRIVGYFGRQGFVDQMPTRDDWFGIADSGLQYSTPTVTWTEPPPGEHVLFLLSEGKLWSIDSRKRQVRMLCQAPVDASIGWVWDLKDAPREPPPDHHATTAWAPRQLLVRSNESCVLVNSETGEQTNYPLPPEVRQELFTACRLSDGNLLLISNGFVARRESQLVMWIEPGGKVVRSKDLRLAQLGSGVGSEESFAWLAALAVPFIAGQAPILCLAPLTGLQSERFDSYWAGLGEAFGFFWPALLVVVAIGGIAAVATYRRQKRFGLPGRIGWAVFALLFGVPGWISYRFHRSWPMLEDCPACQQPAPRNRGACIECGADFPPPAPKGIEVFA